MASKPQDILNNMEKQKISTSDVVLLRLLQKNARITNKELARAAGIAESTCLERVRSLQQRGVIRGWHARVDLAAIGRPIRAFISVRLQPKTTTSIRAFQAEVLDAPETISLTTLTGADDFIVEVAVSDVDHLRTFVIEHIDSRPNVADTRTALVYEHRRKAVVEPIVSDH
jgi:DNA-binding Lrp family transcriptional regulator